LKEELTNMASTTLSKINKEANKTLSIFQKEELEEMFDRTKKGEIKQTLRNCVLVFQHDPVLCGKLRYNLLSQRVDIIGEVPWTRISYGKAVSNSDMRAIHLFMEERYGLRFQKQIDEAMYIVADSNLYHPVRDFLNSLPPWDGTERIRYALHHFLGAKSDDYTYEVFKFFLLGAVSRIFSPGTKFDNILCLVGSQGAGKSTFFRYLAVDDDWYSEHMNNLESEKVFEKMMGHWIIEMSEMLATSRAKSNEAIKSFLSRQKETYRTPYDKLPEDRPRQCVFVGTTNKESFLPNDRTGNRRFLPIQCDDDAAEVYILDNETYAREYLKLMWAEVMEIYRSGNFRLKLPKDIEEQVTRNQKAFLPEDTDAGMILAFMTDTAEQRVCSRMLFKEALGNEYNQPARWQTNEICEVVNHLIHSGELKGWRAFTSPKRFRNGYGTQKGWERTPEAAAKNVNQTVSTKGDFQNLDPGEKTPFDDKTEKSLG